MTHYLETSYAIEVHNGKYAKGEVSYKLEHNHMSDLTTEERAQRHMGFRMPPPELMRNGTAYKASLRQMDLPKRIDWRDWNIVSPVKDQGACGSCWTFSVVGALETAFARRNPNYQLNELSEQQLLDCASDYGCYGCSGGFMNSAFQYVVDNGGIIRRDVYPYIGEQQKCRAKDFTPTDVIRDFVLIPKGDEEVMREALALYGPLAIAFHAGMPDFGIYKEGIYDNDECDQTWLSHAVVLVGYGEENGIPYWLLKNSWGEKWGEDGYFRFIRGKNMCGVANMASYPII